jgi:ubiquinone biosynthesis protein UbiJ
MQAPVALLAALETAINQYLQLDPEAVANLAHLQDRIIAIHLRDLDLTLYFIPTDKGLQLMGQYEGEADATISGTSMAMLRMGLGGNKEKILFSGDVEIAGDTELGHRFKNILDKMDIDWEEHLSRIIGDVAAHQLGRVARSASQWMQKAFDTLTLDTSEYLQEELRMVSTNAEIEEFNREVDTLRTDVDRMEARVKRLQEKL